MAFRVAIRIFEQELRAAIVATTKERTGRLLGSIKILYNGKLISGLHEIDNFGPDDYLLVFSDVPYAYHVNERVANRNGIGWARRAAKRIRTATRSTTKTSALQIGVVFSRALGKYVEAPEIVTAERKALGTIIPAIRIRLRKSQFQNIQGA